MLHGVLTVRRSSIAELRAEEHGLCAMNWHEAHPGEPFAIDWELYHRIEDAGGLDVLAAWEGDHLSGYLVVCHHVHPQSGQRTAVSAGCYVRPGADAGFALRKMLRLGADVAKAGGAQQFYIDDRIDGRLGRILMRDGFRARSVVYERGL